jgi:hypothetical protein
MAAMELGPWRRDLLEGCSGSALSIGGLGLEFGADSVVACEFGRCDRRISDTHNEYVLLIELSGDCCRA